MYSRFGFPNYIQPEANMHLNILLFSTHKAVITLQDDVGVGRGRSGGGGGVRGGGI